MGLFGSIFGTGEAVSGVMSAADKLIFTPQEKANLFNHRLSLYEPFKIAQRLLAITFCVPYSIAWITVFFMSIVGANINDQLELLGGTMGQIVLAIVAFYFLGGVVSGFGGRRGG